MINLNANVSSISQTANRHTNELLTAPQADKKSNFNGVVKAMDNYISEVDGHQQMADMSIKDLLSGQTEDISSVIAAVAKADMSFKLLVGVRNKLIEAYKQTMNMPL
ncbi:MAG TPA: flagellar hook-basal body complex protein FliE [Sedimentisphaerales bacterium]|nr:flagellar hook-basal body complex protein FliE [Sedimentisphaerales bacterium]